MRIHVALLKLQAIASDKRYIVLEACACVMAMPHLTEQLYAAYDCNRQRVDLLHTVATALANASKPQPGMPLDGDPRPLPIPCASTEKEYLRLSRPTCRA